MNEGRWNLSILMEVTRFLITGHNKKALGCRVSPAERLECKCCYVSHVGVGRWSGKKMAHIRSKGSTLQQPTGF